MYESHFGLREAPFSLTPDTSFFYACATYQEALNTLLVAARNGEGFIKIVGEVGTGKTLLCRKFLASLGDGFVTAYIPNPYLDPQGLLLALAEEFRVELDREADQHHLLKGLSRALLDFARQGRRALVCLDEAQAMPLKSLEVLRLLTNLETEKRKLLQVVLFGQPELDANLSDPSVRQLKQRITFQYTLGSLRGSELDLYLAHRLRVAGYEGGRLFTPGAVRLLRTASHGTPRLANILAHKSLMAAFGQGSQQVTSRHVMTAARDTPAAAGRLSLRLWLGATAVALSAGGAGWVLLK